MKNKKKFHNVRVLETDDDFKNEDIYEPIGEINDSDEEYAIL